VARFVLATANPHKVTEMRAVLAPLGVDLLDRPHGVAEVDETEDSLEGNALLKARAVARATGLAAIADDTGLFVDALEGRPGVQSARYSGAGATDDDNVVKLLDELDGVDMDRRGAHFKTVICVAYPDGTWYCVEGVLEGTIAPVFAPSGHGGRTLAEMTPDEKNAVSHRAIALRVLALELAQR
jgi:XTP/dITP diphosphohydrolase